MMSGHWLWLFLSMFTPSCALRPLAPPPPVPAQTVAILLPNNRTDDPLVVGGESLWDVFFTPSRQVTIADILAAEARAQLEQRGFRVIPTTVVEEAVGDRSPNSVEEAVELAAQGRLEGNALYIEIKQWESDIPMGPICVFVSLDASLIDTASGRIVWTTHRPLQPVPIPGAINQSTAYMIAAHQVTKELLGSWGTKRPTA